jgi:hypothetical protein
MLSLLVSLLIFCVVAYLIWWLIGMVPLPPPVRVAVLVVFVLICIVALLNYMPLPHGRYLG